MVMVMEMITLVMAVVMLVPVDTVAGTVVDTALEAVGTKMKMAVYMFVKL
jgi:hypothetical protein